MVESARKERNLSAQDEVELDIKLVCKRLDFPNIELLDMWLREVAEFSGFIYSGKLYITALYF